MEQQKLQESLPLYGSPAVGAAPLERDQIESTKLLFSGMASLALSLIGLASMWWRTT